MKHAIAIVFCIIFLLKLAPAQGQETVSDDEVNRVAERLYCPTCASQALSVCPTQTCWQWREEIRRRLADGHGEDEILAYFRAQFGEEVLGAPRDDTGRLLTFLPLALIMLLAGAIVLRVRRRPVTGNDD